MKTVNIIIPYFGQFPDYFKLFLKSCEKNPSINWTIITDNTKEYNYPPNVSVIRIKFESIKNRIQEKFNFKISLESPHKLCEYKPAYGYIFPEIIKGYDYWGYGDLDLIYGDLRSFLTETVLTYDKVFTLGHFSLIKNDTACNEMFMRKVNGKLLFKEAFSSPQNYNFDEQFLSKPNINTIFEKNGYKIFKQKYMADIYTKSSDFRLDLGDGMAESRKNSFFVWDNGSLKRYTKLKGQIVSQDFMYIHLQKRKMKTNIHGEITIYKIIPNSFDPLEVPKGQIFDHFNKIRKKHINFQYFRIRSRNLKTKIKHVIAKEK